MTEYELYKRKLEKIFNQISKIAFKGKDNKLEYFNYVDELIQKGDYGVFEQCVYYFFQIDINIHADVAEVKESTWPEILFQTRTPFLTKLSKLYKEKKIYQSSFDIYSDDPNRATLSTSGPLSVTYSVTGLTASISLNRQGEKIFINVLNPNIFQIEISKTTWENNLPTDLEYTQTIRHGTYSSTYQTNIPVTHTSQYLIRTQERSSFDIKNYKFLVTKSGLLGQLYEREIYNEDVKYLMQNKMYARVMGQAKFYLEVQKIGATSSLIISEENPTLSDSQNLINNYKTAIDYLLS